MLMLAFSLAATSAAAAPLACSWEVETTPLANNFAFPDTNAIYWTSRFVYEAGLEFELTGSYPDARYMSFNTYNSTGNSFTVVDGGQTFTTSIPDYLIAPDAGSVNPYATIAPLGAVRNFTLKLKLNPAGTVGNVLPLAPITPAAPLPGDIGYFIMRAYLRDGTVQLPTVRYRSTAQPSLLAVPQCPATPGSNNPPSLSNDSCSGPGCGALAFARSPSTGGNFPNADTVYVSARVAPPFTDNRVVVVRGLAPESPTGSLPRPWPNTGVHDTRYWSMCNNVSTSPNPVVVNTLSPGVLSLGCRGNDDSNLRGGFATGGFYTYVLARESRRAEVEALSWPGINFLPFSTSNPQNEHLLLLRNMVPDATFAEATKNVPAGSSPAQTHAVMGPYYPRAAYCLLSTLQAQGPDACVPPLPDLTISKTHTGNFAQGQIGASYRISVTAATTGEGGLAAGNTVTVTDTPPPGLTVTAIAGSGWTCAPLPQAQPTCSRSDALAAGLSYPPITVTVTVAANATSPQLNSATVTTTATESNSANNSATDSTIIVSGTSGSLTVARRGSGSGTVASLDGGINCGTSCANAYVNGSVIALLATPVAGSAFTGWLGGCTGTIACAATIAGAATVSATFALLPIGTTVLDIDSNSLYDAPTDGLMSVRAMFGLTGTAVTNAAVGSGAARSDPALIDIYLSDIRPYLDIDGNGAVDALTDGLLLMRHLLGLTGPPLIQGALGPGATRSSDTQVQDYLSTLKL